MGEGLEGTLSDNAQKLAIVEGLIEDFRWASRGAEKTKYPEELKTYNVLREIAADIRAASEKAHHPLYHGLRDLVEKGRATKTAAGYTAGALVTIAQYVLGHWPVLRRVLEDFDERSAEAELYNMMAMDCAPQRCVEAIADRWPHVAAAWDARAKKQKEVVSG